MNFARLNHILIPSTKDERDRFRDSRTGRWLGGPLMRTYLALTDEGRILLLFVAIAGFAGLDVGRVQNYQLWSVLFGVLIGAMLVRRLFRLRDVEVRVEGPERVMAGEEVTFRITLDNHGDRDYDLLRIERPMLPWDGSWIADKPALPSLAAGARHTLTTRARFDARGQHHLDRFHAGAIAPLRLTMGDPVSSEGTRFIVVPRICPVQRLRIPTAHRFQPGGVAMASKTGESMELCGVRPYQSGDRIRDLHAKTWARIGQPVVREYQQEYFTRIGVVLDTDGEIFLEEQLEAAISLTAGIVSRLSREEALIDLLVTGHELHPLTLGRSLGSFEQALDHLACVESGPELDPKFLIRLLRPYLSRLSSVVFVALAWDERRQRLASQIRASGVGCRVVIVPSPKLKGEAAKQGFAAGDRDVSFLAVDAIEKGEAILL